MASFTLPKNGLRLVLMEVATNILAQDLQDGGREVRLSKRLCLIWDRISDIGFQRGCLRAPQITNP